MGENFLQTSGFAKLSQMLVLIAWSSIWGSSHLQLAYIRWWLKTINVIVINIEYFKKFCLKIIVARCDKLLKLNECTSMGVQTQVCELQHRDIQSLFDSQCIGAIDLFMLFSWTKPDTLPFPKRTVWNSDWHNTNSCVVLNGPSNLCPSNADPA